MQPRSASGSAVGRGRRPPSAADVDSMVERIVNGNRRTLSRCISWIENDQAAAALVAAADHIAGEAMIVGVTGVPGAGKSTLVPAIARRFAEQGMRPAIVAVDPSSPLTGGAILGDRIRDSTSGGAPIFFRSIANRGNLGGLSHTLDDVVTLLDAAGFDAILVETVGTGQSEIAVTDLAHTTIVATAPGLGDEIQAMKAGILEVSDLIVVNKADADPRGAAAAVETLRNALALNQRSHGLREGANLGDDGNAAGWLAPVRGVSALKGDGVEELCELIHAHRGYLEQSGGFDHWRRRRRVNRFRQSLRRNLETLARDTHPQLLADAEAAVATGTASPIAEAAEVAERLIAGRPMGWSAEMSDGDRPWPMEPDVRSRVDDRTGRGPESKRQRKGMR